MAPENTDDQKKQLGTLPASVTGPIDLGRLMRELEGLDNHFEELRLRQGGDPTDLPKVSHLMDQTLQLNKLNLLLQPDRQSLHNFLAMVKDSAPVLHISFGADPSPIFLERLMTWLRREIHPLVLLTVGLQLNLGAGCIVRTTNKYFDCSLRQDFTDKRDLLKAAISVPTGAAK